MKIHKLSAYGLGAFVLTFGATLAFGQARVPYTRPPYITTSGPITTTGPMSGQTFNATTASGNQAYTCTNTGCRLSLGNTGRYFDDNGSRINSSATLGAPVFTNNVFDTAILRGNRENSAFSVGVFIENSFAFSTEGAKLVSFRNNNAEIANIDKDGDFTALTCNATATSGSSFTGGNATGNLTMTSNATDSVTSATVPAIRLQASQNITDADLLMSVEDSGGNRRMTLTEVGNLVVGNQINAGGQIFSSSQFETTFGGFTATGPSAALNSSTNTAGSPSIILRAITNRTAADVKLVSIRNNTTDEKAFFDILGLLRLNAGNAARPTCNADNRGRVYYLDGAAGVADTMQVCMKDASDNYDWETVASP
jgi:hypothetical protein